ncbi:MAG: glycosyltransferase family 9 protein [Chitinophagales bacterium]|nr:glycosyltransferase family 9 protein [Chitinophagales bacterium]
MQEDARAFTPQSILIIQTAFLGDVILATSLVEKLHFFFPESRIDFLLRKGNEGALANNPKINQVMIWDKKRKYSSLFQLLHTIRQSKYDLVVNVQRFAASGILAGLSGAKHIIGFDKNPLSFLFTRKVRHSFKGHEVQRNLNLIENITSQETVNPVMYPSVADEHAISVYTQSPYLCIAPASVWFTKQFPVEKWVHFIESITGLYQVYFLGSETDSALCEKIISLIKHHQVQLINLSGKLSLTQTAALMKQAAMNYVNDSAPLHIASAVNAPVTAVFCSTVPEFGFGPLSEKSFVVEINHGLYCRPCGIHGYKACPEGHFKCAFEIQIKDLLRTINIPSTNT